jgi:hypothetical protein
MTLLILSTVLLFLDGLWYAGMGVCVLWGVPCVSPMWRRRFVSLYLDIFKDFPGPCPGDAVETPSDESIGREALTWRFTAYVLLMFGITRIISSFHWGCGYVLLGLTTCVGEIGLLCNELLCHDSARLHRAMAFVLCNVAVSLIYIGTALPSCRV